MYKINFIPNPFALQPFSNEDQFFQAASKIDPTPLVAVIAEAPAAASQGRSRTQLPGDDTPVGEALQSHDEKKPRGRKAIPPEPFVLLRLYCLCPGTGAPPELETLRKNLKKTVAAWPSGSVLPLEEPLGRSLKSGSSGWMPTRTSSSRLCVRSRREICSSRCSLRTRYPSRREKINRARNRTKETNAALKNSLQDTVGDDEFDEDTPAAAAQTTASSTFCTGGSSSATSVCPEHAKKATTTG